MQNQEHRYVLEDRRVTHRRKQKFTCPQCGGRRCFTRYIDLRQQCAYVDDGCGKCDHLNRCGYHLTPRQYFSQNPSERPHREDNAEPPLQPPQLVYLPLPPRLVSSSHSPESVFWRWLTDEGARRLAIPPEQLRRVYDLYQIGATRTGETIFWQIDREGTVRAGHIMKFLPNGHRDHRYQSWVHYRLQQRGQLPQNYDLRQCLFGEHLLSQRPQARVCVVESEKSAVILAAMHPEELWLATNGCQGLSTDKLRVLQGRHVTLFPDSGSTRKWAAVARDSGLDIAVSQDIERYEPNTDLIDILLGEARLK